LHFPFHFFPFPFSTWHVAFSSLILDFAFSMKILPHFTSRFWILRKNCRLIVYRRSKHFTQKSLSRNCRVRD
jgi:hypothetical protein